MDRQPDFDQRAFFRVGVNSKGALQVGGSSPHSRDSEAAAVRFGCRPLVSQSSPVVMDLQYRVSRLLPETNRNSGCLRIFEGVADSLLSHAVERVFHGFGLGSISLVLENQFGLNGVQGSKVMAYLLDEPV